MSWDAFETFTAGVQNLVGAVALIVGGVWAYYRVIRGRTFAVRLKVQVSGTFLEQDGQRLVIATVRADNVGSVKVRLSSRGSALAIVGYERIPDVDQAERLPRHRLAMLPILESHSWIEPLTVLEEKTVIAIERDDLAAVGLELRVVAEGVALSASDIVIPRAASASAGAGGRLHA